MIASSLNESLHKIQSNYDMPLYKVISVNEKLHPTDYNILDINVERELMSYDNKFESAVKLLKLNFKENFPIVYLTNCIYYDNYNNTLPNGMDVSSKVLIDANNFEYELIQKKKIKTNRYFNDIDSIYPKLIYIYVEEYDVKIKESNAVDKLSEKIDDEEKNIEEEEKDKK